MRRAAGALARAAREGAQRQATRVVGTSAPTEAAAAAAAAAPATKPAASAKPPNVQEFKIYRWSPDNVGEKPYLKSYKARRERRGTPGLPASTPACVLLCSREAATPQPPHARACVAVTAVFASESHKECWPRNDQG
jgi:hypothetical protein